VNDAFGTCHRAHSSIVGVDLPTRASGFLIKKELEYFHRALSVPQKPFVAILGGSKVSDKILLIENLLPKVNAMLIGGGMAYTFKKCIYDVSIGKSLFDESGSQIVAALIQKANLLGVKIYLPVDHICGDKFSEDANIKVCSDIEGIPDDYMGLDIGPRSVEEFCSVLKNAKTILWNGPLGVFEMGPFSHGTCKVLDAVVAATKGGAVSVVGGGDTATAVEKWNKLAEISHVSTGGGASLELLEGKELPGVAALSPDI
jgi:phosphoglycerate kinase